MCFINCVYLIAIIDTSATHSFISHDGVNKLNLHVSYMIGSMVIDSLTNGSVTSTLVSLNCSFTIYGRYFEVELICLQLSQLDIILGMNWLKFNHVRINYFDKTLLFLEPKENANSRFMSVGQVKVSLRVDDQVLVMFASLRVDSYDVVSDMPAVWEFSDVFLRIFVTCRWSEKLSSP